jgi:hypothetical protein
MTQPEATDHVAVYIDFDNIVISRYDELHGDRAFHNDGAGGANPTIEVAAKLETAKVDLGAIFDYANSFGTVAISRAYADWSAPANHAYHRETLRSSIDLVQMFPLSGSKNGADIRLAIDVIDDLSRYDYISHVLIVAGDSDYVSLAQRCKRLGRTVIGVGAARSVGRYWQSACDVFRFYDAIPGVSPVKAPAKKAATKRPATAAAAAPVPPVARLLRRAMGLQAEKSTDGWVNASTLKNQILRLDPTFDEKAEGHKSFTAFLAAHPDVVETRTANRMLSVRLK